MTSWYQHHHFHHLSVSSTDSTALPPLAVVALDNLALVEVNGADSLTYLQGQLTCDLFAVDEAESTLAAHCDSKGKVWSILRLFRHLQGIAYVQPASVAQKQLQEIKKYAVFSKVDFSLSDKVLLGVCGEKTDNAMLARFTGKGNVRQTQTGTAVRLEANRWLLAMAPQEAQSFIHELGNRAELCTHHLWDLYELKAGLPIIEEATTNEFIPQSLNLQALDAISFKKGCYTGQETVARAKYRGINKRATYLLMGEVKQDGEQTEAPVAGDSIERSVGENWRSGGTVLRSFLFSDNIALALVVLPNNFEADTQFRQCDEGSLWHMQPLPYEIDED